MEGMKIPTRPAPKPPDGPQKQSKLLKTVSEDRTSFFGNFKLTRSKSTGKLSGNKKPPPRPPPPPVNFLKHSKSTPSTSYSNQKQPLPNLRSQNRLGQILSRNASETSVTPKPQTAQYGELIDFSSPHHSPTFTSHSNSDNFSIRSFGSDGTFTGFNSASSQVESGFEDDFDLLTISSSTATNSADPWGDDLFSNKKQATTQSFSVFELSNEDPRSKHKELPNIMSSVAIKPTIIRPKSSKPARPPPPRLRPASTPPKFISFAVKVPDDWSPPMPSCPPPPPPPEAMTLPAVPPRPTTLVQESVAMKKPYCIALYDYNSGHPDDLSFKVNDVIFLTEKVSEDWLRGSLDGTEGMFPVNYTKIVVPLDNCSSVSLEKYKYAVALYTFRPETWDDLPFEEGDNVKVTRRINNHWLYGECNGKQGQFPESYITDVSSFFPFGTDFS